MATNRDVFQIFVAYSRRYTVRAAAIYIAIIIAVATEAFVPTYLARFIDSLGTLGRNDSSLVILGGIVLSILALKIIGWAGWRVSGFLTCEFQPRVIADMNRDSFAYTLDHSYQFFSDTFVGSLVRKINRLTRSFEAIGDEMQFRLLPIFVIIIGVTIGLWLRFPIIAILFLLWAIFFLLTNYLATLWKLKLDIIRAAKDSEATGELADALTNSVTVKSFSGKSHEIARFAKIMEEWRRLQTKGWSRGEIIFAVQGVMILVLEVGIMWYSALLWKDGVLSAGGFVLIQSYLLATFGKLWDVGRGLRHILEALIDAKEMVEILQRPHEVSDVLRAKKLTLPYGEIEFARVGFAFHETRSVVRDFSLRIDSKEKLALVGPSGAGKSTIVKLLFRFYDVSAGKILIDGQDIAKVTQESLRDGLTLVPQEPILFHRSLKDNIRYGRREATDAEVEDAAKRARCHEFIMQSPQGYETFVGERGVKLSGGERQRIAIARAILKDAPILVLDEATSSLDSESERLIQEALAELMQNKTAIVIAHRLSTIMKMDRIVVMENGAVSSMGTHQELLAQNGTYRKLWDIQVGGFLADADVIDEV